MPWHMWTIFLPRITCAAVDAVDLAVHGALIACVCVRCQTPFLWRHESGPSLFLSKGKHLAVGQLPWVSFSVLPGQSSGRPNPPPHKNTFRFQFPFASIRRMPSEPCSWQEKRRMDRSTSKRSSKKLERAAIRAFFLDRSLAVMHCDRSWPDGRREQWPLLAQLPVQCSAMDQSTRFTDQRPTGIEVYHVGLAPAAQFDRSRSTASGGKIYRDFKRAKSWCGQTLLPTLGKSTRSAFYCPLRP